MAQRRGAAVKLDSVLADLARHASRVRPGHALGDLHALSPAARFITSKRTGMPLVAIDAVTRGEVSDLEAALASLGLEHASVYANDVGGWLPVSQLEAAAALGQLIALRAAMPRTASMGSVSTQGDYVQGSIALRALYPTLTGAGVIVGVLSDSFDCYGAYEASGSGVPASGYEGYASNGFTADYATDVTTGALPVGVNVLAEPSCLDYGSPRQAPFSDEGRAMLQIVHAVAPGASLAFHTADISEADFANGIIALQAAGAKVIADDVTYFDEPYFQDGIVAQAINTVEAKGVAYFTAAGNNSDLSYQNTTPSFATLATNGLQPNEKLLNFDASGTTTTNNLPVTIPPMQPGELVAVVVEWDQPYVTGAPASGGATSQLDLVRHRSDRCAGRGLRRQHGELHGTECAGCGPLSGPGHCESCELDLQYGAADSAAVPRAGERHGCARPDDPDRSADDGLGSSITQFATQQRHGAGTPQCRQRGHGRRRLLFRDAGLRDIARHARGVLIRGRGADAVRHPRYAACDASRAPEAGFRRAGRRQRHLPRVHAGERRYRRRKARYRHHRMPKQSRLSELLRHLGGNAARRRHRSADPAGELGCDSPADLLGAAKDCPRHGLGHAEFRFGIRVHPGRCRARAVRAGCAHIEPCGKHSSRSAARPRSAGRPSTRRAARRPAHGAERLRRAARRR